MISFAWKENIRDDVADIFMKERMAETYLFFFFMDFFFFAIFFLPFLAAFFFFIIELTSFFWRKEFFLAKNPSLDESATALYSTI